MKNVRELFDVVSSENPNDRNTLHNLCRVSHVKGSPLYSSQKEQRTQDVLVYAGLFTAVKEKKKKKDNC